MRAAKLPASAGWHWVSQGLMIFLYKPLPIFAWAMLVMLALMLAALAAPIGPLLFALALPTISFLSFMLCRFVISRKPVTTETWLKLLRRQGLAAQLFWMGFCYTAWSVMAAVGSLLPYVFDLPQEVLQAAIYHNEMEPLLAALRMPMIVFAIVSVVIGAFFWYSPALVGFCGMQPTKAMFYSVVACWRNKSAFLVYGLLLVALYWAVGEIATMALEVGASPELVMMVQIPVHLVLACVVYCSVLPSFADVFDESVPPAPEGAPQAAAQNPQNPQN